MRADFPPLQVLLLAFSGWVNRRQQHVVDYLVEEIRDLREQIRDRRLRLTDCQRRRLAAKGKRLGRLLLTRVGLLTPVKRSHPGPQPRLQRRKH